VFRDYALPHTLTTVLQDWMKSRRSEVDEINGLVADVHRAHGHRAHANELVVEVAHRIEAGDLEPDPANVALLLGG
jgi:2-dehydropantoate 2-reductase